MMMPEHAKAPDQLTRPGHFRSMSKARPAVGMAVFVTHTEVLDVAVDHGRAVPDRCLLCERVS
jgi:hypothetical protein